MINPLILDGQIHGGVAQGIGNAFYEKLSYSEEGQLLSGSFMDYFATHLNGCASHGDGSHHNPHPHSIHWALKEQVKLEPFQQAPSLPKPLKMHWKRQTLKILEIPLSPSQIWEMVQNQPSS